MLSEVSSSSRRRLMRISERTRADQLVDVDRLVEEVVGAQLVGPHLVLDPGQRREHDDRHEVGVALPLEALADLEAVEARHHHVEDDAVGHLGRHRRERLLAVGGEAHAEALVGEHLLDEGQVLWLVVDGQDRAARSPARRPSVTPALRRSAGACRRRADCTSSTKDVTLIGLEM